MAQPPGPAGAERFARVRRSGRWTRPLQHARDPILWLSGSAYDVVFDEARNAIATLAPLAAIRRETSSWPLELEDRPDNSHVARTDQEDFGDVFRRNMPYGTVTEHGTMFVDFAAYQSPLERMLTSMAGIDGPRDEPTRYTTPLYRRLILRALGSGAARATHPDY